VALYVLMPPIVWLAYRFGEPAICAAPPVMAATFWTICSPAR
jgi:hypothetical protein